MHQNLQNLVFELDNNAKATLVDGKWKFADHLGAIKTRSTLKRNNYKVDPGLYKIGNPSAESEVFISANYKLSFDVLRKNLDGLNAWIVVLDTKGVNVWCAAGKKTFGTEELINRIELTGIKHRINHNRIIVPQLGAPGVSAHKVSKATGLKVIFGPVKASDIKTFIRNDRKASNEMRRVRFTFLERLVLSPVEIAYSGKYLLLAMLVYFLLSGLNEQGFSISNYNMASLKDSIIIFLAFLSGTFLGPILLPILPFRALALKGLFSGLLLWLILYFTVFNQLFTLVSISFLFSFIALGSFFTMNFTGATTYTSLSGVKLEMKYAIPLQLTFGIASFVLFVISKFV